ncbi:MAG TPA: hypothetical protein VGO00_22460, partial [Kofleriaceae bacterium]|nr:hypothetical protein [Kofleriaceae bacterium]
RTPPTIVPEDVATDLENRIHAADEHIFVDEALQEIALDLANGIKSGLSDHKLRGILNGGMGRLKGYVTVLSSVTPTVNLAAVDPIKLVNFPKIDHVGIAVIQGHHPTLGDNVITIVVVMARRPSLRASPKGL